MSKYLNLILWLLVLALAYPTFQSFQTIKHDKQARDLLELINWKENDYKAKNGYYIIQKEGMARTFVINRDEPMPANDLGLEVGKTYPFDIIVYGHPNGTRFRALVVDDHVAGTYPNIWWFSSNESKPRGLSDFPKQ